MFWFDVYSARIISVLTQQGKDKWVTNWMTSFQFSPPFQWISTLGTSCVIFTTHRQSWEIFYFDWNWPKKHSKEKDERLTTQSVHYLLELSKKSSNFINSIQSFATQVKLKYTHSCNQVIQVQNVPRELLNLNLNRSAPYFFLLLKQNINAMVRPEIAFGWASKDQSSYEAGNKIRACSYITLHAYHVLQQLYSASGAVHVGCCGFQNALVLILSEPVNWAASCVMPSIVYLLHRYYARKKGREGESRIPVHKDKLWNVALTCFLLSLKLNYFITTWTWQFVLDQISDAACWKSRKCSWF